MPSSDNFRTSRWFGFFDRAKLPPSAFRFYPFNANVTKKGLIGREIGTIPSCGVVSGSLGLELPNFSFVTKTAAKVLLKGVRGESEDLSTIVQNLL